MSDEHNYTLRAFTEPLHFVALLGVAIFAFMALGSWRSLFMAVAIFEAVYLLLVPRLVPYKRRVRLQAAQNAGESQKSERDLRAAKLSRDVRRRYQALAAEAQGIEGQLEDLDMDPKVVSDLLNAALEFSLSLEQFQQDEIREPLAELKEKAAANPQDSVLQSRLNTREEGLAMRQKLHEELGQLEALLGDLKRRAHGQQLESSQVQATQNDVDTALKTAREMAAFDIARR